MEALFTKIAWAVAGLLVLLFIAVGVWFFFFRPTAGVTTNTGSSQAPSFGNAPVVTGNNNTSASTDTSENQTINTTPAASSQKIFEIAQGPLVGSTLIQTLRPTTTIARYIRQDDGHVFDVPLGVAGAVPRVVSNITIPGGQRAVWLEGGNAALLQYVDDSNVIKTVYLGFPTATTTAVLPTRIQFLPDNIIDVAASPDGKSVAYLLKTSAGSDGYIAKSDGTNSKKIFSLPLSQLSLSWPSAGTMLLQTRPEAGVTGMAFAADAKTGNVSPLFSAMGISAIADSAFSEVIYQQSDANTDSTYVHNIKSGLNYSLPLNPYPEMCVWSKITAQDMYCAQPLTYVGPLYLDLWHQGAASAADGIYWFDTKIESSKLLATPGSIDGGQKADVSEMALSPNEQYISYVTKGDRSLWGVVLSK